MNVSYDRNDYTPEAKRARFLRVAERRTNVILDTLNLLGNTSNRNLYRYTEADVEKIFSTIEDGLGTARARFNSSKQKERFSLEDD